jgi:glycosyltransferase involved in cell wall biosynthesis
MAKNKYDIVFVVTNDLNSDQRMHRICNSFLQRGDHILIIGHQKKSSLPILEKKFGQKRIRTFFNKGPLFYLEYNIRVFLILMACSTRYFYAVDSDTLLSVGMASILGRTSFVFDAHEYFSELPELAGYHWKKAIWTLLGRIFIPRAKHRITVGKSLADQLESKYNSLFIPVYNYPMIVHNNPTKTESEEFVILYQGKLNVKRGLEEMVEAMIHLSNCELWIIGDGDIENHLIQLVNDSKARDRIRILGWKSPQELIHITPKANLGLNLLHSDNNNYYFSSANKVFDYIMAGIPSLTMNFPEYAELNEKHDILYLIDDLAPSSIASLINNIIQNQDLYLTKSQNCLKARKLLNWENESQKLLSIFQ